MSGEVKPGKRARGFHSPSGNDYQNAADLLESFKGRPVEEIGRVSAPKTPRILAVLGTLDGVLYTTERGGREESYIHEFAKGDKPLLAVSPNGEQLFIVGGNYDMTERGIVDGSDSKTRRELKMNAPHRPRR